MDFDGRMIPWYGVGGNILVPLEVQETIKIAEL